MKPRVSNHQIKVGLWEIKKQSKRVKAVTVLIWSLWVNLTATPTWLEKKEKTSGVDGSRREKGAAPLILSKFFLHFFSFSFFEHTPRVLYTTFRYFVISWSCCFYVFSRIVYYVTAFFVGFCGHKHHSFVLWLVGIFAFVSFKWLRTWGGWCEFDFFFNNFLALDGWKSVFGG